MIPSLRILISGGGTGGHIFPAIAIADALRRLRAEANILFVGANGRMEMERVPAAGYPIVGVDIAGLQRGWSWDSLRRNAALPLKLWRSWRQARRIVRDFRPNVVVGTGGYASWAVLRVAQQMGIPTLIQEQNSYAGLTNRLLAKRAKRICVAYEGMDRYFPADRLVLTGNPVRLDFLHLSAKRSEGRSFYGLSDNHRLLAVVGGSLGARTLNEAMARNTALLAQQPNLQVVWQCGRFYEQHYRSCTTAQLPHVRLCAFIERMDLLYAAADVVVARAGALTVSELAVAEKPAILVPSPNVAEDHQTRNAKALVDQGAALLVPDARAPEQLVPEALSLLASSERRDALRQSIRRLARPNAAEAIAHEVLRLCSPVTDSLPIAERT